MIRLLIISCLLLNSFVFQAQVHTPVFPSLEGAALLDEVIGLYKPTTVLEYDEARDVLYGTIYKLNDSVSCVYSGHTLYLPPNVDPSSHLFMNSSSSGINAEHTYPRSKGASEENGNAFSDMHHLYPTRSAVNTSRSNFPFGEIEDTETTIWFFENEAINSIPTSNIDQYSERITGLFEPREDHKGNVARAVFYFFAMYEEEALEADPDFFESQRTTLCEWHEQDPIDLLEWERTYLIADYQDNQPNPFILDCTLAQRSYCQEFSLFCEGLTNVNEIEQSPIALYPNPVVNELNIEKEGEAAYQVLDILGRTLQEGTFINSTKIDFTNKQSGTYFIIINQEAFKIVK